MRLAKQQRIIILERSDVTSHHKLKIVPTLAQALKSWKPSTRVSPIFGIDEFGTSSIEREDFRGTHRVFFAGPIHPERILDCCTQPDKVWVTLGLYNLFVVSSSDGAARKLLAWLRRQDIAYEMWLIRDGVMRKPKFSAPKAVSGALLKRVSALTSITLPSELAEARNEYCPLMASTISRTTRLPRKILDDLAAVNQAVATTLKKHAANTTNDSPNPVLGQLLWVNAGLSHFSSQTLAGSTPITETECHFWSHSLLGIGVATLGLWRLTEFVRDRLEKAAIPEHFSALSTLTESVPALTKLHKDDSFWERDDYLTAVELPPNSRKPLVPMIPYFSARDGFKSTPTSISVPLAAVGACNSLHWSLLTITHEMSHVLIRYIIAVLYGDLSSPKDLQEAAQLLQPDHQPSNLLGEIRRLLFFSIFNMDSNNSGKIIRPRPDPALLRSLLVDWYSEVEEIMVHAFDFLYFYGRDVPKYVSGIWVSWGTIPNIESRVHEYVVRTVCAVMSVHLRQGSGAADVAAGQVGSCLKELQKSGVTGTYVESALRYIDEHWDDEIREKVIARMGIIRIVRTFLFALDIATSLRHETEIVGGESETEGYSLRHGHLELKEIENPLRFLELYTKSKSPSPSDSAWLFYVLAFCVRQ